MVDPKINWNEYEEIPADSYHAVDAIVKVWDRLGQPHTPFDETGAKVMDTIIAAWQFKFPKEYMDWIKDRSDYQKAELSIKEQVHHHTGRTLAAYPFFVFQTMKRVFPDFKPAERNNCMKMVRKWPIFRYAVHA